MLIYCHFSLKRLLTIACLSHALQNADFPPWKSNYILIRYFFVSRWLPTHPLLPYSTVGKNQKSCVFIAKLHPSKSFNCKKTERYFSLFLRALLVTLSAGNKEKYMQPQKPELFRNLHKIISQVVKVK